MKDRDYLAHISKAIEEVRQMTAGVDRAQYLADIRIQRALEREIQIIGDAVHKLSPELVDAHPDIDWKRIYAARNVVVHAYWGVDQEILWDVVETKLEPLYAKVTELLAGEASDAEPGEG